MRILVLFFLVLTITVQAQNFEWAKSIGGTQSDVSNSISLDASGNIYISGYFYDTVDFDPGANVFNLSSNGEADIFVQKFDPLGNFLWARSLGGAYTDFEISNNTDAFGNLYITGHFRDSVDFNTLEGTINLIGAGVADVFILKIDSSGNFLWARSFGSSSDDVGESIVIDNSGNVYTTGYFKWTVDFDPGPGVMNITSIGPYDIFIQKLDSSGNFIWAKSIGGTTDEEANAITSDAAGNLYLTGYFKGTCDFDPDPDVFNIEASGNKDIFIQRIDTSGHLIWAKALPGSPSSSGEGNSIHVDVSGNVYVTGYFSETVDFEPGIGTSYLTSEGGNDIFVLKLDELGDLMWARSIGGSLNDHAKSISVDVFGNTYIAGAFYGSVDFDPGIGVANLTAVGGADIFILKLNASGDFLWVKSMGSIGYDEARSVVVDNYENIYTTGRFRDTVDFDPGIETTNLVSLGEHDFFVVKFSQQILTEVEKSGDHNLKVNAYPNPTKDRINVVLEHPLNHVELTLTDMQGKVVFNKTYETLEKINIDLDNASNIYFLSIKTAQEQHIIKVIKE